MIQKILHKVNVLYLLYLLLIVFLVFNTGMYSDDFTHIFLKRNMGFSELILPSKWWVIAPVEHYLLNVWYRFFDINNLIFLELLKTFYIVISFFFITRFFRIFLGVHHASMISFLILFFPSHEATTYFYLGLYQTLNFALYAYAFYLVHHNRILLGSVCSVLAAFVCYSSVGFAIALFSFFVMDRKYKKAAVMIVPCLFYIIHYIYFTKIYLITDSQIPRNLNMYSIAKQFILQVVTFIDSMVGPSMWYKIYYSFSNLSLVSVLLAIALMVVFYRKHGNVENKEISSKYDFKLIVTFSIIILAGFANYSITGRYPQLCFGLGNRTTLYGSILLSYLIVQCPVSNKIKTGVFAVLLFSVFGISDHWKSWSIQQQEVISNIQNNKLLNEYQDNKVIYVSGNQYSKYGPISHIEFLSENWVPITVFKLALKKETRAVTINKRHVYEDGYLVDRKDNSKVEIEDYINIYDSKNNKLLKFDVENVNSYIDSLPPEHRHWIQLLPKDSYLTKIAFFLMPRLEYMF
jgi:hypothetical protein